LVAENAHVHSRLKQEAGQLARDLGGWIVVSGHASGKEEDLGELEGLAGLEAELLHLEGLARLARTANDLARAESLQRQAVALVPGLSIQRTVGGEEAVRLAIALQTVTGDLGRLGGSSGGQTWGGLPEPRVGMISAAAAPVSSGVHANDWADAVLRGRCGGYPVDIKAVYDTGGNYVVQGADVATSIRAMESLEFSVCHELFMTSTARYCDVVMPVTHWLERQDIVIDCKCGPHAQALKA
jgi:anaerobic selenocysteine-containing dehydrogenase